LLQAEAPQIRGVAMAQGMWILAVRGRHIVTVSFCTLWVYTL
jgi:hypothetical protein